MARDKRPNLDVSIKVQTTGGATFELGPSATRSRDRPTGINWRTKLGEGFSDGGANLARRVDQDHPDVGLMDVWTFVDDAGDTLFEGRVAGNPRDLDQTHSIGVTLIGRMADAKRRKFTEVYVDRGVDRWQRMPLNRRIAVGSARTVDQDYTFTTDGAALAFNGVDAKAITINAESEAWYTMPPGLTVASLTYQGTQANTTSVVAPSLVTDDNDALTSPASVALTLDDTLRTATVVIPERYAALSVFASATHTPAAGAALSRIFKKLAVYSNHGLTRYAPTTTGEPNGVRVTDVMRDIIARFCTGLNADGVKNSDYVAAHLAFTDRIYPYDAFLQLNKYLLWKLAAWEDGRVVFEPHDLTDYTWQIDTDDPNVSLNWQGPSTETIYNGVAVTYTDLLTGITNTLTPATNPELADTDPENPFNQAGIPQWLEVTLSRPELQGDAAAIGVAELAEANRPKAPGMFTVRNHIRNRAGDWQHVGKVRAGETIAIVNHPNDDPRLIVETDVSQTDNGYQLRLSTDLPFNLIEAIIDRQDVELQAAGLRA